MATSGTRDIIVVGASMGGIAALSKLVSDLPVDLPASVFVVQHSAQQSPGLLAELLTRAGPLPAETATDHMVAKWGRIYVAPPDRHMLLTTGGVRVLYGPRENRVRPAIDPLFRTAAVNCRSRVIGLILTGLQGDGASGLSAVHRCGGVALVQSLEDATHPEMPSRALAAVPEARQVELAEAGALLSRLARERAPEAPEVPAGLQIEARLTERAMAGGEWHKIPSHSTDYICPECGGPIREIEGEKLPRYRCRVGHAYSAEDLTAEKGEHVEAALWMALETLDERTRLLEMMAQQDRERGWMKTAQMYGDRAQETRAAAMRLREVIGQLGG
jgi:two-component system chemotaxis response regulator CheB